MLNKVINLMMIAGVILGIGAAGQGDYEMATNCFTANVEIYGTAAIVLMIPWVIAHRND